MSFELKPTECHQSDEEEELLVAFEQQLDDDFSPRLRSEGSDIFHSIDGMLFERPDNPIVAVLEHREALKSKCRENLCEEKPSAAPVPISRKRKTLELPNVPAQVIRPVAKRAKANIMERSITAPPCLKDGWSLERIKKNLQIEEESTLLEEKEPFRSASVNISNTFQPIFWPGDAAVSRQSEKDRCQSCSSSSSSKSWGSGFSPFCRVSLDAPSPSPMLVRFNDLVLHSSSGEYTGS